MTKQKRQTLTEEQILNIQKQMEEAKNKPIEKRVYTKKETVIRLKKHILEMQKKGYTLDDIRLFFEKNGLVISLSSLKSYLGSTGSKRAKKTEGTEASAPVQNKAGNEIKKETEKDTNSAQLTTVNDIKTKAITPPKPDGSFKVTPDRKEY